MDVRFPILRPATPRAPAAPVRGLRAGWRFQPAQQQRERCGCASNTIPVVTTSDDPRKSKMRLAGLPINLLGCLVSYTASSDPMGLRDRSALAQGTEHGVERLARASRAVETRFARPCPAGGRRAQTRTRVCLVCLVIIDCCRFCSAHRCTQLFIRVSLLLSAAPATSLLSSARVRGAAFIGEARVPKSQRNDTCKK